MRHSSLERKSLPWKGKDGPKSACRDLEDIDLWMEFDPLTLSWQRVEAEKEVLEALKELGKARAATVASAIGAHRGNTSTRLQKLWKDGKVHMELIDNISYYFLDREEELEGESV
jgi:hypothetical protein